MTATDVSATDGGFSGVAPTAPAAAPRIAFQAHPQLPWLLMPEGVPMQVLIDAVPVRVPNTRAWFKGVVSQRGNLLPVFDLADWAGLPAYDAKPQIVSAGTGTTACAIVCAATPTLLFAGRETTPAATVAALEPFLGRAHASAQGIVREFDLQGWLAAAAQDITGDTAG